uniref:Bro-a n=1 Tax=Spodoptera littoralis nuclear polyhedrosis virus TaxID=10456 RepID=A0A3G4S921_NPVSL|nr:bro-a [Spodoptera littoralis nucleopolyhedrovirus]
MIKSQYKKNMIHRFIKDQDLKIFLKSIYGNMKYLHYKNRLQSKALQQQRQTIRLLRDTLKQKFNKNEIALSVASSKKETDNVEFVKLCVLKNSNAFYVITGQSVYVRNRRNRIMKTDEKFTILIDTVTASPKIDCNMILNRACKDYGYENVIVNKRKLVFINESLAEEYAVKLQQMFLVNKN